MIRRIKNFQIFSEHLRESEQILFPDYVGRILGSLDFELNEKTENIGGPFTVDLENGPKNHGTRSRGDWESDNAWDIFAPAGTVVNSYTNGKVTKVYSTGSSSGTVFGTQVSIKGQDGYPDIFYTHIKNVTLKKGDTVKVGDKIGEVSEWQGHDSSTHVHVGLPYGTHLRDLLKGDITASNTSSSTTGSEAPTPGATGSTNAFGKMTGLELLLQTKMGKELEGILVNSKEGKINATESPTPYNELLELLKKNSKLNQAQQNNASTIVNQEGDANSVIQPDAKLLPQSQAYSFKNVDKITWTSLKNALEVQNLWKKMDPEKYNLVAVRNYLNAKKKSPNHFIDLIVLMSPEKEKKVWTYRATTVPGPMFMSKPFRNWYLTTGSKDNINPKGLAIVQPGVFDYKIGTHNGYKAFNQKSEIEVDRYEPVDDPKKANFSTFSPGKSEKGIFGINIHRANKTGETETVDTWSAGCLVFSKAQDLKTVLDKLEKAGQKDVKVALVQMDDIWQDL